MPTDTKNSTANASWSGSDSLRGADGSVRTRQDHAREKGAERERHAEQLRPRRRRCRARWRARTAEQFARAGAGDVVQQPGNDARPTTSISATKAATFASVSSQDSQVSGSKSGRTDRRARCVCRRAVSASAGSSTSASTIARSSTMSQPTAICPLRYRCSALRSSSARSSTTVLATDSDRPKTRPAPILQPSSQRHAGAHGGGDGDLRDGAGQRDGAHRQQVLEREVQADAEHQQDDADFREFGAQAWSATKPGVNGPTRTPASR